MSIVLESAASPGLSSNPTLVTDNGAPFRSVLPQGIPLSQRNSPDDEWRASAFRLRGHSARIAIVLIAGLSLLLAIARQPLLADNLFPNQLSLPAGGTSQRVTLRPDLPKESSFTSPTTCAASYGSQLCAALMTSLATLNPIC